MDSLESIGWCAELAEALAHLDPSRALAPARVSEERKGSYQLMGPWGELRAEVAGRLLYRAAGPEELPVVGDWVAAAVRHDEGAATIQAVLPRRTALVRRAPERPTRAQVLAANVDAVLLVTSANRDFNTRRIERSLALAWESGARPVVVLSKRDLCDDPERLEARAREASPGAPVLCLSSHTGEGMDALRSLLGDSGTSVLLGSSGVGKSTLLNSLVGRSIQATLEIRADDNRGRHATTHRQLVRMPQGGVLIDTPGLREVGLWSEGDGFDAAFPEIEALARECRFHDCEHRGEPDCAVAAALADGRLDRARLESQRKLERELRHVEERRNARGRHESRKRAKRFARQLRQKPDKRRR